MADDVPDFDRIARRLAGVWADRGGVDGMAESIANALRAVYRPVPRCDQCRWWKQRVQESFGDCTRFNSGDMGILVSCSDRNPLLVMRANFGCVQWERKA